LNKEQSDQNCERSAKIMRSNSEGVEVGDLPGRKCQPHQAVVDLFRDYGGGQACREGCPQGAVEQALRLIQMVPGHVDKIIDARHPAEIEPHPNEMADIVRLIDEYEANQKAKVA
jgi:hypothetical protein